MSSDIAIHVQNVSKCYQIYDRPQDRLKQPIVSRIQQLFGRPPKNYYRDFWALRDISFEVKKGETVGIIGRNGSGKSTLLQMICGTLTPTTGVVETTGRVAALLELGSGFNPDFTGHENVYMNAAVLGLSKEDVDTRFDDIVAFADIGEFIEQPVKTYSSGMVVRLAFSVIVNVDADILIIDEALSVGDAFFVQKCMRFLRNFMENGTVIFVSHDTDAVLNLCEKAIWLETGKVKSNGLPKEVMERYLESFYMEQESESAIYSKKNDAALIQRGVLRDMRLDFINQTKLRNDIELFGFNESGVSFGKGKATIKDVFLVDTKNKPLSWVIGGEEVTLIICCHAKHDLTSPIIGFIVKDRLGQNIFADNTYLNYINTTVEVKSGDIMETEFTFIMPVLPVGDYSISAAIAEGSQDEHIQHHWLNDALIFKVHTSSVCHGLIGVPMKEIRINVK